MLKARPSVYEGTLKHEAGRGKLRARRKSHRRADKASSTLCQPWTSIYRSMVLAVQTGAVWKSRWPSWAFRPNEPYGFCGRKAATLNHALRHWSQFVPKYVNPTSEDTKLYSSVTAGSRDSVTTDSGVLQSQQTLRF